MRVSCEFLRRFYHRAAASVFHFTFSLRASSTVSSRTWRRRSSVGGGVAGGDGPGPDTTLERPSTAMKLVSRLRGGPTDNSSSNKDGQQPLLPHPPPSTLPGGRRLSVAAAPSTNSAATAAAAVAAAAVARDRSRSLCVERLGLATLLHPAAIPTRDLSRRRASSAL